jgi:hypothetical protein
MITKEDIEPVNASEIVALRALVRELLSRQPVAVLDEMLRHAEEDVQIIEDRIQDLPEERIGLARRALEAQLDIVRQAKAERRG